VRSQGVTLAHAPICSMWGVLIALTLEGTSSRHVKILFANHTSSSRRYDSRDGCGLPVNMTSCSSAGLRTTLQNAGNRQRTYRHYDIKFQYKANRPNRDNTSRNDQAVVKADAKSNSPENLTTSRRGKRHAQT